tara:strand:- start:27 stop:746 length:720 start_codon:yes stop_codon:yes gene_type:complete
MLNLKNFSAFFIANWKLNGNLAFIKAYFDELKVNRANCVVICPPSLYLNKMNNNKENLFSGAQDVSRYNKGAYTGEFSAEMLRDLDVSFCIVGHSERRQNFNEDNITINIKVSNLIKNEIIPIICIGETLDQKKNNETIDVLKKQILDGIPDISSDQNTIIAYEPIWAIGTGLTPTLDEINMVHNAIKNIDSKLNNYRVLYGGSVNSSNSKKITELKSVAGCLIGGSSLKIDEFNNIIS